MYESVDLSYSTQMIEKIRTMADWKTLAKDVLESLSGAAEERAVVLVLSGDLGAGKTTFTQALALELGVTAVVNSPTFTIMKRYDTTHQEFSSLIHMDAYRIETVAELRPLGFSEWLTSPGTLICIEWGERIKEALPERYFHLSISHNSGEERVITWQLNKK